MFRSRAIGNIGKRMSINLIDYFDKIYVINLRERVDRRAEMQEQFQEINISPSDEKIRFFPAIRPTSEDGFPSIGARGCFLSHLSVLRDASQKGYARVLILEDDVNFVKDIKKRIAVVRPSTWKLYWKDRLVILPAGRCTWMVPTAGFEIAIQTARLSLQCRNLGISVRHARTFATRSGMSECRWYLGLCRPLEILSRVFSG